MTVLLWVTAALVVGVIGGVGLVAFIIYSYYGAWR